MESSDESESNDEIPAELNSAPSEAKLFRFNLPKKTSPSFSAIPRAKHDVII